MKKLSIVICLYNEEENIEPLIENLDNVIKGIDFEVIMVNDGSADNTEKEISRHSKPWLKLINFRKNYGQSAALAAGIDQAVGEYIVTMDGDLQNDPSDIPMMLSKIESEDWELIAGYRENRKDNLFGRKLPSLLANLLIRKTTRVKIKDYGCTLKIFRSYIAKDLSLYGELHRFIPVLASLEGATRIGQVSVKHHHRLHGKSKYGIGRTLKVMSDLLLMLFFKKYMVQPMHLFGSSGIIITLAGVIINLYLLVLKILGHDIWGKPLLMLGIMLFLTGIQFITIGLITEILMRTYFESQGKKPYNIKSIIDFESILN
jgi:glycosyltransferase involved in cell wall biosynthesis